MTYKPVIAIDGPAASGKGTLARRMAAHGNMAYLDTGALYRAVGNEVLLAGGNPENEADALVGAQSLSGKIASEGAEKVLGNSVLKEDHVAQAASKVAAIQPVRDALMDLQRNVAKSPGDAYDGAVLDGRDIGTVICPDADLKLYITADDETRAERRTKELQSRGIEAKREAVLADLRERDKRDTSRAAAPLRPADDAIVIDTSDLSADDVFKKALQLLEERGLKTSS